MNRLSRYRRQLIFGAIGIFVMLLSFGELWVMMDVLGLPTWLAYVVQTVISVELNFMLNYLITWRDRREHTSFGRALVLFHATRVGLAIPLNQVLFMAQVDWLHVPFYGAQAVCIAITTVLNYVAGDKLVFGSKWAVKKGSSSVLSKEPAEVLLTPHLPFVSVVVPVKNRPATTRSLVESWLRQDYTGGSELILVGDVEDSTWDAIRDYVEAGLVRVIEADVVSAGRDANAKRNVGLAAAKGDVLALTDSDIVLPQGWITRGIDLMQTSGHLVVAGPFVSIEREGFLSFYTDKNPFGSKTPRMDKPYILTAENCGKGKYKPPVTASMFIDRKVYESVGGLDEHFVTNYEDYPYADVIVRAGFSILCDGSLVAYHHHRDDFKAVRREWLVSGFGCADYILKYPFSHLAAARARQFFVALMTFGLGAMTTVVFPVSVAMSVAAVLSTVGLLSWRKVGKAQAFFFPFVTTMLVVVFLVGMTEGFVERYWIEQHKTVIKTVSEYSTEMTEVLQ